MVADVEELESLDASGIRARRLSAREVLMQKNGEHFIFPIEDGTVTLSGRGQVLRTSTSIQDHPASGEEHNDDLQRRVGRVSTIRKMTDVSIARNDFWSIEGKLHLSSPR